MYIATDSNGRITAMTDRKEFAIGMREVTLPDDFDSNNISDYIVSSDGTVTYSKKPETNEEKLARKQAEQSQQLSTAVTIFVLANADSFTNEQLISVSSFFPDWKTGHKYTKGEIVNYNGNLYRIGQDHTSQSNWLPDSDGVTALYSAIKIDEETGYETWKAWDGVSGIYAKDQIVKDPNDGLLYKSTIANNVWGPPSSVATYWTKVNGA